MKDYTPNGVVVVDDVVPNVATKVEVVEENGYLVTGIIIVSNV
ncbi:hypothetical protein [Flavobacterium sp. XGLA_31]